MVEFLAPFVASNPEFIEAVVEKDMRQFVQSCF